MPPLKDLLSILSAGAAIAGGLAAAVSGGDLTATIFVVGLMFWGTFLGVLVVNALRWTAGRPLIADWVEKTTNDWRENNRGAIEERAAMSRAERAASDAKLYKGVAYGALLCVGGVIAVAASSPNKFDQWSESFDVVHWTGIVAVAVAAVAAVELGLTPRARIRCPDCANRIAAEARKCHYCGFRLHGQQPPSRP